MSIEKIILSNLLENETYTRRVLPYIKSDYFAERHEQIVFSLINHYVVKYSSLPSKEAIMIDLEKIPKLSAEVFTSSADLIKNLIKEPNDEKWLLDTTEEFCKQRSVYNAVMKAIRIYDDKEGKEKEGINALPNIFSDAISVSFDQYIGHDYIEQFEDRWDYYNRKDLKIPFEVDYLNKVTDGGLPNKTLTCLLAGIGCVHPDTKIKIRIRPKPANF